MNTRRSFLLNSLTAAGSGMAVAMLGGRAFADRSYEVAHTDAEWRKILSPEAYEVMRHQGTERSGSSPIADTMNKGIYDCAGCALPLFSSATKFHSGTGWPSFYKPLSNAVLTTTDNSWIMERTEVHCRRCGGHLGHVFDDGPPPTGLRYCMNGVALKFMPDKTA
ncbi:MAG TPA: peptide-methionine (R)-S-oxide reductase MsrB [Rhizomicrobium sp.]|jgi:peptide-methionine (R)-S-oxide reductase